MKDIDFLDWLGVRVIAHPGFPVSPIPMYFTPDAIVAIRESVGRRPPETGAKGFGPTDRMGVDVVEFDDVGSGRHSAVYQPDHAWSASRLRYWLHREPDQMRLWTMVLHSHPGRLGQPSPKMSPSRSDPEYALGDLGYAEAVFRTNEAMQYLYLPILTGTGRRADYIELHPWIVCRDNPFQPMIAEVCVDVPENFPARSFNPEWESSLAVAADASIPER